MPLENPSGYGPAAPGGRDPGTGAPLMDRFHQLRGNEYNMTQGTPMHQRLAVEFLQSRGAPVNAQNLAIAQSYLGGGGLSALDQQQGTESAIADEAMAAEGGGGAPGVQSGGSANPAAPMPQPAAPVAAPVAQAASVDGTSGIDSDLAAKGAPLLLALLARRVGIDNIAPPPGPPTPEIAGSGTAVAARGGLNGEVLDAPQISGARPGMPVVQGGDAVEDAIVTGVNPAQTGNALPPPVVSAPQAAAPQPNPYAAQVQRAQAAPALPSPDDAPISTEEVMPQQKTVGTGATEAGEYTITKDGDGFKATGPGGEEVRGATAEAVRRAIRKVRP